MPQTVRQENDMNEEQKKQLALEVIRRLKKEYPDTHCTLAYQDAWQLLVERAPGGAVYG